MDLFGEIHAQTGITIVVVTHTSQPVSYGTRPVQMANGQIIGEERQYEMVLSMPSPTEQRADATRKK